MTATNGNLANTPSSSSNIKVHIPICNNTSSELCTSLKSSEFCWILGKSGWITEAQTFYFISKQGDLLLLQIAYSNLSWPAHATCQISAFFCDSSDMTNKENNDCSIVNGSFSSNGNNPSLPSSFSSSFLQRIHDRNQKGHYKQWSASCNANKMKLNTLHTSLDVKQTSIQQQSDGSQNFLLAFEENEYTITLTFSPLSHPFQVGDGKVSFGKDKSDGHVSLKFIPFGTAQGTLQIDGLNREFDGYGFCIRQFQCLKPYLSASRWNLIYFQSIHTDVMKNNKGGATGNNEKGENELLISDPISLILIQMQTPSFYDNVTFNIGTLFIKDKLEGISTDNQIIVNHSGMDTESKYTVSSDISVQWSGVTFDNKKFRVNCDIQHQRLCTKVCLLDSLPYVVRKMIESFVAKPFIFQWVDKATINLQIDNKDQSIEGWLFHEITQLNEK